MKNQIPVIVDNDPLLGYEGNEWPDIIRLPISLVLSIWVTLKKKVLGPKLKINTFWFDGLSPVCREIKENARKWRALDIIYNYNFFKKELDFRTALTNFWLRIKNARAVRNRLKLIKKKLREEIGNFSFDGFEIRLLSIASGSAQGVIEVMEEFNERNIFIRAVFLDLDPTAIEYSKTLARKAEVINQIIFINKSVRELEEAVSEFKPHIVEMVGFLDYRPREKAITLIEKIHRLLVPNGVALISNIVPNAERWFLSQVINWPMIYRSSKDLSEVITKSGFYPKNCQIIYEPLKIQGIAICRK